jgi:hypothetical protein
VPRSAFFPASRQAPLCELGAINLGPDLMSGPVFYEVHAGLPRAIVQSFSVDVSMPMTDLTAAAWRYSPQSAARFTVWR